MFLVQGYKKKWKIEFIKLIVLWKPEMDPGHKSKFMWKESSRKHTYYNSDPLKPHFYIVQLGFTGVYIIFLFSAQNRRLWVLVRTASLRRF